MCQLRSCLSPSQMSSRSIVFQSLNKVTLAPTIRKRTESGCLWVRNSTKTKSSFFLFYRSFAWSMCSKSRYLLTIRSLEALLSLPSPKRLICGFASLPRSSSMFIISYVTVAWVYLKTFEYLDFVSRRLSMTIFSYPKHTLSPSFGQKRVTRKFKI